MSTRHTHRPLRTALIGLSSSAATSWASTAHLPNFLTTAGKSRFTINALLNSSVSAAQAAVKFYNLPSDTKTYGKPEDLAQDPDIDFVVCNTRVDKHLETTIASIKAGKSAYVEWPIAANPEQIRELREAAKQSGAKVAIGLQGRWAAPALKLKEIVEGQKLGKILHVEVSAYGGSVDRSKLSTGVKYFTDRKIGGNPITIGVGHVIDFVLSVVGQLVDDTVHTRLELQRPNVPIRDSKTGDIIETVQSNVPDLLYLDGRIKSPQTAENAALSFRFRRGQPFPGTPSLDWRIGFENGEVRLESPSGISIQASAYDEPVTIQLHDFATGKVEDIAWEWNESQNEVPIIARGVQSPLYAFADGVEEGLGWVGLEDAAKRAAQIERWLVGSGF